MKEKMMTLNQLLVELAKQDCYPGIYRRGDLWRAHVNIAGNFWHDDTTPLKALCGATQLWKKAGKPMDGEGAPR